MVTEIGTFFGGATYLDTPPGAYQLRATQAKVERVQMMNAPSGMDVTMPDARLLKTGGPIFYLCNVNLTFDLEIKDYTGGTLLAALKGGNGAGGGNGELARMYLVDNLTAAGIWIVQVRTGINF